MNVDDLKKKKTPDCLFSVSISLIFSLEQAS